MCVLNVFSFPADEQHAHFFEKEDDAPDAVDRVRFEEHLRLAGEQVSSSLCLPLQTSGQWVDMECDLTTRGSPRHG